MSTANRRRGQSLRLDLSDGNHEIPPIAALFLITFDVKKGYSIAWSRAVPDLELKNSVEYKSLPSGLHNVQDDLVYFTHDGGYVGASAYVNKSSQDAERNSLMIAVGALVPSRGLGRAWTHADGLKQLSKSPYEITRNPQPLEEYWAKHQLHPSDASEDERPENPSAAKAKKKQSQSSGNASVKTRNRAVSTASALAPSTGQGLSAYHPANSLRNFLETFGPLIFPIYKIALLRRRLLICAHAPIEPACNFVYDTSLVSGIPSAVSDTIPLEPLPFRLHPHYSVGLHDVDTLSQGGRSAKPSENEGYGWVACTTDDIISQKPQLYDYRIQLPPPRAKGAKKMIWPQIFNPRGHEIKATQRDLRRYRVLKRELRRFDSPPSPNDRTPDLSHSLTSLNQDSYETDTSSIHDADLAEKKSMMSVVYEGFMWWAAAGEKRTDLDEEEQQDASLLRQVNSEGSPNRPRSSGTSSAAMRVADDGPAGLEVAVVAFFHRLTTQILKTLADVVVDADDASVFEGGEGGRGDEAVDTDQTPLIAAEDDEEREPVLVEADDMSRMGLDLWSESDRAFVEGLIEFYWGRKAKVAKTPAIECCGVRIC